MKQQKLLSLPRSDIEKQKILEKIAEKTKKGKEYSQEEIDSLIKSFNVDDFILFRRELINFNYLARDPSKGIYWLKKTKLSQEELNKIGKNQENIIKSQVEEE